MLIRVRKSEKSGKSERKSILVLEYAVKLLNNDMKGIRATATNQIKDLKIDIIDRISSAKIQTILWVVGVGVLQLVAHYFLK